MRWYSELWVKVCLLAIAVGSTAGVYTYFRILQPTAGLSASITSEPLKFSMELDRSEFQYGENMTITFRLENMGNETVTVCRLNPGLWHPNYTETSYHDVHAPSYKLNQFHFGFSVAYANGTEFFGAGSSFLDFVLELEIDPGGWIEQTIIARTRDTPDYMGNYYCRIPLPKGSYQIRGAYFTYAIDHEMPFLTLETPSITFVIQ